MDHYPLSANASRYTVIDGPAVMFGVWARTLAIAVGLALIGLGSLFGEGVERPTAVALLVGGSALALFAWRRAKVLVDALDAAEATQATVQGRAQGAGQPTTASAVAGS